MNLPAFRTDSEQSASLFLKVLGLCELHPVETVDEIVLLALGRKEQSIRMKAIAVLKNMNSDLSTHLLQELLEDENKMIRAHAWGALDSKEYR